jgi:acetate kinase
VGNNNQSYILTVNAGSSSIKFAIYSATNLQKFSEYEIKDIGQPSAKLLIKNHDPTNNNIRTIGASDHVEATVIMMSYLKHEINTTNIVAIGHRIVHGGPKHFDSILIDDQILEDLRNLMYFDPEHLPTEIKLIETFNDLFDGVSQYACFDTAYHQNMPTQAKLMAIPRRYFNRGIHRYGFHGISCEYIYQDLFKIYGQELINKKIIIAHLGSGASLTAINRGQSVDTTMGLTPASGISMSTRSGDIDPGFASYLSHSENLNINDFSLMLNFESGLLGVSGVSADMKKLLSLASSNPAANEAIELFCYQIKKSIGSFSAILNGVDIIVFTGGIGEEAPIIRAAICENLDYLGIELDKNNNQVNLALISTKTSKVDLRVMHTDEANMIAKNVYKLIKQKQK